MPFLYNECMKTHALISIIFVCLSGLLFSQPGDIRFEQIALEDGLSQNSVFTILQDSRGFLWFGTQDGLNKYDGYSFKIYKPEPGNPRSISHNDISTIMEDKSGMLWIGTKGGGLNLYDPAKDTFTRMSPQANPDDPLSVARNLIYCIFEDRRGVIWIGTLGAGFSQYVRDEMGERFIHHPMNPDSSSNRWCRTISSITEDSSGIIWLSSWDNGIIKYNPKTYLYTHIHHIPGDPGSLSDNRIGTILEDRSGMLWIGTAGGLDLMDTKTGKCRHFRHNPEDPKSLSSDMVFRLFEDRSGVLWVGTYRSGLNRFDRDSETFTRFRHQSINPHSLSSDIITCIYEDRSRVLWIGTPGSGVNKYNRQNNFKHYTVNPQNPNSVSHKFIFSLLEDHRGHVWIGTRGGGLNHFDPGTGKFTHYRNSPGNTKTPSSDAVAAVLEDRNHQIWLGTEGGGLNKLDPASGQFTYYLPNQDNPDSIGHFVINYLLEDSSGTLWLGTDGMGLDRFNVEKETFSHYRFRAGDPTTLSGNRITSLYEAPSEPGILWAGTYFNGLNRFETSTGKATRIPVASEQQPGLPHQTVMCTLEDRRGNLWTTTYGGGISKLIRSNGKVTGFIHYTEKDGLANNATYGMLEDDRGFLWISSNSGISRFDPEKETFKNYNTWDGLQAREFNAGAFHKGKSGTMYFGGINGFNTFTPADWKTNPYPPPVVITDFKLFHKPVPVGGDSPLQRTVPYTRHINLSYRENVFQFQFAALDYTVPGKNRYAYKMENFDSDWIYPEPGQRYAAYTNLGPGEYVFRVKGSNNDDEWNQEGASIKLTITPPFWGTWWFRFFVIFFALGVVYLGYRKRLHNVRLMTELQTARDAQMSIMPQRDPGINSFDISGLCIPAHEVGGDFFDYIWMNEEKTRFGIAIGDVSGKAMKSAMTAVMTSGMIYLEADCTPSVKEIMIRVNRPLYFKTDRRVFTALCLACLDLETIELSFTNAGLNEPLLKSGGYVRRLKGTGNRLPLGVKKDTIYHEQRYKLEKGDVLVFFTDGLSEAKNPVDAFYGTQRLEQLLIRMDTQPLGAKEIKSGIIEDINRFAEGESQYDDMTVVVVKVTE